MKQIILLFVFALLAYLSVAGVCRTHDNDCTGCTNDVANFCGFCGLTGECLTGNALGPTNLAESAFGGCSTYWQVKFASQVVKRTRGFPVNPIAADIYLISNGAVTLHIDITRPFGDSIPIDLVVNQDASGSMGPFMDLFGNMVPRVVAGVLSEYPSSYFASNCYCDKPYNPFGGSSDVIIQFNGKGLTDSIADMQISVKKSRNYLMGGNDLPEDPHDAEMMALTCQNLMRWRSTARKFMLTITDADWHTAGQNYIYTTPMPNSCFPDLSQNINLNTLTFPYRSSSWGRNYDFISDNQLRDLYISKNTIPIVGKVIIAPITFRYNTLFTSWGFGRAADFSGTPDSVVTNILAEIEFAAGKVLLRATTDPSTYVTSITPAAGYTNVATLQTVGFDIVFNKASPVNGYSVVLQALGFTQTDVKIWTVVPCFGCDGIAASGKYTDKCGICDPAVPNACLGCDGVPFSGAIFDTCGICDGDNTVCAGCDGIPYSGVKVDVCNLCGGDNSTCLGCDGVPFSGKRIDICDICGGDNTACLGCDGLPNSGKVFDLCGLCDGADDCVGCDGIPNSGLQVDLCGICGGNNTCLGCDGVKNSGTVFDVCGICDGDGSTCPIGCDGVRSADPKGYDLCDVCDGDNACLGCDYVPFSNLTEDLCGVCGGDNYCVGCDGIPRLDGSSPPAIDLCGVCGGANECLGCDYIPNSGKLLDSCGICGGFDACFGCDSVPYSGATYDICDVCNGDGLECLGCDGFPYSAAIYDACGKCKGDNSTCAGCDGVPNSRKTVDACGVCGGNSTCVHQDVTETKEPLSPLGVGIIVAAAVIALVGGILAAVALISVGAAVGGPLFALPAGLLTQLNAARVSEIHKEKKAKVNPFANK
jgi:hypothetical protein